MSLFALKLLCSVDLSLSGTFSLCIGYSCNTKFIFISFSMVCQGTDAALFLFIDFPTKDLYYKITTNHLYYLIPLWICPILSDFIIKIL